MSGADSPPALATTRSALERANKVVDEVREFLFWERAHRAKYPSEHLFHDQLRPMIDALAALDREGERE